MASPDKAGVLGRHKEEEEEEEEVKEEPPDQLNTPRPWLAGWAGGEGGGLQDSSQTRAGASASILGLEPP